MENPTILEDSADLISIPRWVMDRQLTRLNNLVHPNPSTGGPTQGGPGLGGAIKVDLATNSML